jgi:CCR4-NOT transcription complex subunit 1
MIVMVFFFPPGILRQPSIPTGFGHALNIETLVAAAERRDTPIEVLKKKSDLIVQGVLGKK